MPRIDVSDDLRRELIYAMNAELLRAGADAAALTSVFFRTLREDGPRYHEPHLLASWSAEAGLDVADLEAELEMAISTIVEELEDEESPWSAHRVLDLLAEEDFWTLSWGCPGENLPPTPAPPRGVALPLPLRDHLVRILDRLELRLHDLRQAQRSVHDPVPTQAFERALGDAMDAVYALARRTGERGGEAMETALTQGSAATPTLQTALREIQTWKLAVDFDASPDADDGEWTMRVLDRLYGLEWFMPVQTSSEDA